MSRAGLDLKYDGIIFQQVGELLFNVEATRDIRAHCADSYWHSLNNFVFGAVFGAKFLFRGDYDPDRKLVSRKLPKLIDVKDGWSPGEALLEHFPDLRFPTPPSEKSFEPESLITDPFDPGRIRDALAKLEPLAHGEYAKYWHQYIIREVVLSCRPAGGQWEQRNGFWQFDGRENFWPDTDKEGSVPHAYTNALKNTVKTALPTILVNRKIKGRKGDSILEGFIKRNAVAHLAIYFTLNSQLDRDFKAPKRAERITHVTRSSLAEVEAARGLWRVQTHTVPGLLANMIGKAAKEQNPSDRRKSLLEQIKELSGQSNNHLLALRNRLAEAVAATRESRTDELKKIVDDLDRMSVKDGSSPQTMTLLVGKEEQSYKDAIALLHGLGAGDQNAFQTRDFFKVFPELRAYRGPDRNPN